jgi:hypothetical protein
LVGAADPVLRLYRMRHPCAMGSTEVCAVPSLAADVFAISIRIGTGP